jgi:very-short-patch-repair endonuclease
MRHPHVFVLPGAQTQETEDWAAVLAAGTRGVASGWSAARRYGWDWGDVLGEPCVAVPRERHVVLTGVRVLRWGLAAEQVQRVRGLTVTTPARTVADCLRLAPERRREWMLDTALVRRWTTVDQFAAQVRGLTGQWGVPVLRALLADVTGGALSRAERLAQQVMARTGLTGWEWNYRVELPTGGIAVLDGALPELKIAIEIDGRAYHVDPERFQRDRSRQNGLVTMGWTVLRFTWWDLTQRPDEVVHVVLAAVARAS